MSDEEVEFHIKTNTRLNRARAVFSAAVARLEQAEAQRAKPTIIERRRMEFEAVQGLAREMGIEL